MYSIWSLERLWICTLSRYLATWTMYRATLRIKWQCFAPHHTRSSAMFRATPRVCRPCFAPHHARRRPCFATHRAFVSLVLRHTMRVCRPCFAPHHAFVGLVLHHTMSHTAMSSLSLFYFLFLGPTDFIVATTKIINGSTWIESLMDSEAVDNTNPFTWCARWRMNRQRRHNTTEPHAIGAETTWFDWKIRKEKATIFTITWKPSAVVIICSCLQTDIFCYRQLWHLQTSMRKDDVSKQLKVTKKQTNRELFVHRVAEYGYLIL